MSKDREGREDKDLEPTAGADEVVDLDKSADSGRSAAGDANADMTDPESEAADAFDIQAEIEEAEIEEAEIEEAEVEAAELEATDGVDLDHSEASVEAADLDDSDSVPVDAEVAAVGAGSNRAALRKAGARSGVTEKKATPTRAREDVGHKSGLFSRLARFIREVVAELRKVIWPSQKQMVTYTIVVITFLIFMVALVSGLDVLFHFGVGQIFG